MSPSKSAAQGFSTEWQKAAAWAASQGIPSSSYIPVFQLDQQRLASYGVPMSVGERTRAIIAANNPNDVTSAPTDNPSPSNVLGNARRDLGMVMTGLEPQKLLANLFDTTKNTIQDIANPDRLKGKSGGLTVANWLQNTLLSFVPGAYDIGTVLRADPTLSGDQGFKALAKDPLISLLDVVPTDVSGVGLLTKALSKTDMGAALASKLEMTPQQFAGSSLHKLLTSIPVGKMGVDPAGGALGNLTVGQFVTTKLQDSWIGTSAPVQSLAKAWAMNDQHFSAIKQNILQEPIDAYQALDETQKAKVNDIVSANLHGENIQKLMDDPSVDPAVRDTVTKLVQGPLRFAREEAIAAQDVVPVRRPDGSMGVYTSTQDSAVLTARDALEETHRDVLGQMEALDPLVKQGQALEAVRPKLADSLQKALDSARQATETDPSLLENATEQVDVPGKKKPELKNYGAKRDMARKLFGTDGMVDLAIKAAKEGKTDQLAELTKTLKIRLSKWGEYSVDAASNPAFHEVLRRVRMLEEVARRQDHLRTEINKRIEGNADRVSRETVQMREDRQAQSDNLKAQQATDRANHTAARRQELSMIDTSMRFKIDNYDRLFEQMKEAALVKGDQAAERATKPQADAIYQQVRRSILSLAQDRMEATSTARRVAEESKVAARKRWDKTRGELKKMHDAERSQLRDEHYSQRAIDGEVTQAARAHLKALRDFHRAVYDHPTDNYRDMVTVLYQKNLLDGIHNAELIDHTESRLKDAAGWDESRVEALRRDPVRLRETVAVFVRDVYDSPDNFDPRLVEHVKTAKAAADKSANDEINRLAAQGYHPEWIPAVGPFERPSSGIRTPVGRGVPHVDAGFRRTHGVVNTRFDIVAGATKAVTQALKRDASIEFMEHYLSDKVMTGDDLRAAMDQMGVPEQFDPKAETLSHAYSQKLADLGLTRFDPNSLFGTSMPRWEGQALYMPSGLAKGLETMMALQRKESLGIYDKATDLFRFSILGLSPRYTAHILFGGSFLLALRSTPYMPLMVAKAYRAMKDGTIPSDTFTRPVEEGYQRLPRALEEHGKASGKQMAHLAIQEHIEKVQGVLMSKASPFHYLKAAAELNLRFTHYVTNMQRAVAYLDGAAQAERRGTFINEDGIETAMTKERAMAEGQKHATAVFGDMRSMSPIERQMAGRIFPFYGWSRHILKYVMSYPADHPWRAMVLSLMAYENSEAVPKGLPERIQFLFFLGSPDAQGNVSAVDTRFLDPLRDTASYATLGGWLQGLNPAILAPLAMINPSIVYGSNQLYPNLSYDQFYGISTAGTQGTPLTGLEQFVPQLGALATGTTALAGAISKAGQYRSEAKTNPNAFYKGLFQDLNIPMAQVQHINVKQIAAKDEVARYGVAKQAAATAFETGNFALLNGYANVPNPLNPDYDITPKQLAAVYNAALAQYPGQAPDTVIAPPPPPPGL